MKTILVVVIFCCVVKSHLCIAQAGEWTWMSGASTINGTASYGTQGVPSVNNHPPGLYEACEWTDTSNIFWLYGGDAPTGASANLWKYDPETNQWTWVKGPGASYVPPVYGTQGVAAPGNSPGSRGLGIASFTGKDGSLWLFGGIAAGSLNDLWKYDISTNEWTWMNGPNVAEDPGTYGTQGVPSATNVPPSRSECAASWVDTTGNFWLFGGWKPGESFNDLWKYDPLTNEWTWMKGSSTQGASNVYGIKGVSNATNTPGARNIYTKWNDGNNNLYLFGGDAFTIGALYNDVWKYSIAINEWVWISGTNVANSSGSVSAQCQPDTNNYPSGRRESRACWVDPCNKFWFYGGSSQGSFYGSQNDLWKFDPVTLEWTWVSGSLSILQSGSFGTQGVSSSSNQPPSRSGNLSWVDKNGNLWLFGGTDTNWPSSWNDLWRFVPDSLCSGENCATSQQPVSFAASDTSICEKFCIDFQDFSSNNPNAWQWNFEGGVPSSSAAQNPTDICYQIPGTFDVTLIITDANGSDTLTLSNYITVYPTPPFPVITQVGYTLTSSPANAYQWQLNTIDIPGATNQSYTATETGLYSVVVTDQHGCVSSTTIYILVTGLDVLQGEQNIFIYPNPSDGNFTIEILKADDHFSIDIFNGLGQRIYSSEEKNIAEEFKKEISLVTHPGGIYQLKIKMGERIFLQKLLLVQ